MQDTQTHKQAFWFTIINYLGIVIGLLSTLFLYPYDYDFYGEVAYIDSLAQLIYPVLVFGGGQALIHFYPALTLPFQKKLFRYSIATILRLFLVLVVVSLLVFSFYHWDKKIYWYFALPLGLLMAFMEVFKRQAANLQKIAIPTFYEKIIPKVALPVVFALFFWGFTSDIGAFSFFILFYLVLVVLLVFYVLKYFPVTTAGDTSNVFTALSKKEYFRYSFYTFLGSFGSFLAFRVDGIMVPEFLTFEANGAYRNAVNFATAMAIPATGLFTVYAPQVSAFIKNEDWETLQMKYSETAKLLFFIGAVILGCVFVAAEPFFSLMPTSAKLVPLLPVIYILGSNVLFNMATGFNSEIISYSKYYRFNIIAVFVLVFLNVGLNYYFLTQTDMGIKGVSIATLISLVIFNLSKLIFIYKKMKVQPFDGNYGKLIVVMVLLITVIYMLPSFSNLWIEAIAKPLAILVLSIGFIYKLKLLPIVNFWINKVINK